VEIKVLRYSVRVVAPGCMALVLESLTSRAPYVLENRTPHPLYFRQAATPSLPYQELPPYAAAGFCWRLVSGQPQKVGRVGAMILAASTNSSVSRPAGMCQDQCRDLLHPGYSCLTCVCAVLMNVLHALPPAYLTWEPHGCSSRQALCYTAC